jgi:hypothetical protein
MSPPRIIEGTLVLTRRHRAGGGEEPNGELASAASVGPWRVPRLARLVALAWHIDGLVRSGALASYAAAARLGQVSRARVSQVVSLLNLAPDLQEQLLFLQRPARGRVPLTLRHVLHVARALDWPEQRRRWRQLRRASRDRAPAGS